VSPYTLQRLRARCQGIRHLCERAALHPRQARAILRDAGSELLELELELRIAQADAFDDGAAAGSDSL